MTAFKHTQGALDSAKSRDGWTGWNIDEWATAHNWQGVGLLPVGISRNPEAYSRSNWDAAFKQLIEQFGAGAVDSARFGHSMVGWVEVGTYDAGIPELVEAVAAMEQRLNDYPLLDEDLWMEYEWLDSHPKDSRYCYRDDSECPCGRDKP